MKRKHLTFSFSLSYINFQHFSFKDLKFFFVILVLRVIKICAIEGNGVVNSLFFLFAKLFIWSVIMLSFGFFQARTTL